MADFTIANASGLEGNPGANGTVVFTVTRTNTADTTNPITFSYHFDTAQGNDFAEDYSSINRPFTIPAGQVSAQLTINIAGDFTVEGNEDFTLHAFNSNSVYATGTILNDDVASRFSVNDVTVIEGSATTGSTPLTFTISRDNANAVGSVNYSFANVGTDAADFVGGMPAGGTANFGVGVFTQTVTVNVSPDYVLESQDRFTINLAGAVGGTILDNQGVGIIDNDDDIYNVSSLPVTEGNTGSVNQTIFVSSSSSVGYDRTVYLSFTGITATPNVDFDATARTVVIAAGTNLTAVNLPIYGDYQIEGSETFRANLFLDAALTVPAQSFVNSAYVNAGIDATITDNDVSGAYSVADVSVTEGDTLSQTGQFNVTRTGSGIASVGYTISNGGSSNAASATAGTDYAATTSGTINFAGGQTSAVVQFTVIGDTLVEGNEQFKLTLGTPTNGGTLAKQTGFATIIDNDVPTGASVQVGTAGNDTLIAQTPNAVLVGGAGSDTFLVYSEGATVIEENGGGTDIVYTVGSYNLGNNEVEAMSTAQQTDTTDINLIGNYVSQTIVANYGNNILNGGSGADTLIGLLGNDTYAVGDSRILIVEQGGEGNDLVVTSVDYVLGAGVSIETFAAQDRASTAAINLTGNDVAQTIAGSEGANVINGGAGSDTLIGFGGADTFAFTTALGATNVDTIVDFTAGTDRIALGSSIFAAIGTTLDASEFVTGTTATTVDQHIVYNASTGALFYDADGSGAGAAIQFAAIAPNTALTAAMFTIV